MFDSDDYPVEASIDRLAIATRKSAGTTNAWLTAKAGAGMSYVGINIGAITIKAVAHVE